MYFFINSLILMHRISVITVSFTGVIIDFDSVNCLVPGEYDSVVVLVLLGVSISTLFVISN